MGCSAIFSGCGKNAPPVEICLVDFSKINTIMVEDRQYVEVGSLRVNCTDSTLEDSEQDFTRNILELPELYIASPLDSTLDLWEYCRRKK